MDFHRMLEVERLKREERLAQKRYEVAEQRPVMMFPPLVQQIRVWIASRWHSVIRPMRKRKTSPVRKRYPATEPDCCSGVTSY